MKRLPLLLLIVLALPLFAATYKNIVIRDGDHQYAEGTSEGFEKETSLGRLYASFERDGVGYVIHDAATLARIREIVKPQSDLGRQQARLGTEQAALGAQQAALGMKQAALGIQQAAAGSSAQRQDLAEQQNTLARQQQRLADQQAPLGEQQRILGEKQRKAGKAARQQFETLFEEAIRSGQAKRR